jgi:hypothetical protein
MGGGRRDHASVRWLVEGLRRPGVLAAVRADNSAVLAQAGEPAPLAGLAGLDWGDGQAASFARVLGGLIASDLHPRGQYRRTSQSLSTMDSKIGNRAWVTVSVPSKADASALSWVIDSK